MKIKAWNGGRGEARQLLLRAVLQETRPADHSLLSTTVTRRGLQQEQYHFQDICSNSPPSPVNPGNVRSTNRYITRLQYSCSFLFHVRERSEGDFVT